MCVQNGFHFKVVWQLDLLEFWAIESPFDWFTRGVSHKVGHRISVSHDLHVKDLLGPVTLVAFGELATGLAHPDVVPGCELQRTQAYHVSWTSPQVWVFLYSLCNGPVHRVRRHANGTVICGVISAQQGRQDVHEMSGPVGRHVAMNHALQCPLGLVHRGTFDVIILAGEEVYVSGFSSFWKGAACISVPLSLCTASGGSSCMSSRIVCMAPAISVLRLLVRGHAQAYFENTPKQQKRYLVPSLTSRYSLQSTRLHCSYSLGPDMIVCHRGKR